MMEFVNWDDDIPIYEWKVIKKFHGSSHHQPVIQNSKVHYPLVICYIAIENGHRNSEFFPLKMVDLFQ